MDSQAETPEVKSDFVAPEPEKGAEPPVRIIAEFIAEPDFPRNTLGQVVDIGGYVGEVVNVVNQSVKVRSAEGITKSFNAGGLRKLYGPRVLPEEIPPPPVEPPKPRPQERIEKPTPPREVIEQPDFSKPIRKIEEFTGRADYPRCVFGEHVEIAGYAGVVVEIVNRSLKVRSQAETMRSYNADVLRKLHGH
jgi:hypothetical protein